MSKPPRDLRVSEERGYVADGDGPTQDTDVYSKGEGDFQPERPAHLDAWPRNEAQAKPGDPLRSLRKSAVSHSSSSRRGVPVWLGLAIGSVVAALVAFGVVVGLGGVLGDLGPTAPPPDTTTTRPPPEEIDGVQVRKGLNRGSEVSRPEPESSE